MFHYDTRKYSFSACIVNIWNSLCNSIDTDTDLVCVFKTFGCAKMTLTGVGDRSVHEISGL